MALCKRLIARLDVKGNRLIKGIRFEGLRVLGDPCEASLQYYKEGADELIYIDAVASLYGRNSLDEVLRRTSREVFVPITAGGGVRSVADAAALLAAGADKIAVNTAALQRPELITELAEAFGSQCVVASIQARRIGPGQWEAMAEAGRERSGRDVIDWIKQVQKFGAGELLITSVDQDGTCSGPDTNLIYHVSQCTRIPLVVGGGFADVPQLINAFNNSTISGISLAAALHQKKVCLEQIKHEISTSVPAICFSNKKDKSKSRVTTLNGVIAGVIDYGIGNKRSLINALEFLGAEVLVSDSPEGLDSTHLLVLPGVGSFPEGMHQLELRGLDVYLKTSIKKGLPLLGICLGMQLLFEESEEFRITRGLGLLRGHIAKLPSIDNYGNHVTLPHVGWNQIFTQDTSIKKSKRKHINQYFVHSYAATDVDITNVQYTCTYGLHTFVAGVVHGNIAGFQFHPERSGAEGLELLSKTILEILD